MQFAKGPFHGGKLPTISQWFRFSKANKTEAAESYVRATEKAKGFFHPKKHPKALKNIAQSKLQARGAVSPKKLDDFETRSELLVQVPIFWVMWYS